TTLAGGMKFPWRKLGGAQSGVIMKLRARKGVISSRSSSAHSDGEWGRWFAWYPVVMATRSNSTHWVWLELVERKWSTSVYGTGTKRRRYRLPRKSKPDLR